MGLLDLNNFMPDAQQETIQRNALLSGLLAGGFGLLTGNRNQPLNTIGKAGLLGLGGYGAGLALGENTQQKQLDMALKVAEYQQKLKQRQALEDFFNGQNGAIPQAPAGSPVAMGPVNMTTALTNPDQGLGQAGLLTNPSISSGSDGGSNAGGGPLSFTVPGAPGVIPPQGAFPQRPNLYSPEALGKLAAAGVDVKPFVEIGNYARASDPKYEQVDAGDKIITYRIDPGGNRSPVQETPKGAAPSPLPPWLQKKDGQSVIDPVAYQGEVGLRTAGANRNNVVTNVNSYTPASEEAQRKFMDKTATTYDNLQGAQATLANIEKAKTLVPSAKNFTGSFGDSKLEVAKFFNNNLGTSIDPAGVASAEELRSRLFVQIMDNLKKMDAQPSEYQQKAMMAALGNITTDPNAIPRVLNAFGDIIKSKVAQHNKTVDDAEQRGVKFPFNPRISLDSPDQAPATGGWSIQKK